MKRLALLILGAAATAGLLVAVWPHQHRGSSAESAVSATLGPRATLFGDPVVARISAPKDAQVQASFVPYTVRSVAHGGGTYTFRLECFSLACLPDGSGVRTVHLHAAFVRLRDRAAVTIAWPALRISSRLAPGDRQRPSFRADVSVPRATTRLDPDELGWGLSSAAAALVLATSIWGSRQMRPRARPLTLVPQPEPTELEQALAAVEESLGEPPDRRRTALDALALAAPDADLARGARDLAWSEEAPAPAAMRLLAQKTREAAR